MSRTYDCIIIGAGISGIQAARELVLRGRDVLIVSPQIGGRYLLGENGVNYGAYFCSSSYKNIRPFLTFSDPIRKRELQFHLKNKAWVFFSWEFMWYLPAWIRLIYHTVIFRFRFSRMRYRAVTIGQVAAIRKDPSLNKLFHMRASDWFREKKLQKIVHYFIDEMAYAMSFTSASNHNAFYMMQWTSEVMCHTLYKICFDIDSFIKPVKNIIKPGTITSLRREASCVVLTCGQEQLIAKSIIISTQPWEASKLIDMPHASFAGAHMYHIQGEICAKYKARKYNFFSPHHQVIVISEEAPGSYLLYSRHVMERFDDYFVWHKLIKHIPWTPAIRLDSKMLWNERIEDNIYQSTSFNVEGLEDAYISGSYCARQIHTYLSRGISAS